MPYRITHSGDTSMSTGYCAAVLPLQSALVTGNLSISSLSRSVKLSPLDRRFTVNLGSSPVYRP